MNIPEINFTSQMAALREFTSWTGAIQPAAYMWGAYQDIAISLVIVFTISIAYIRSDLNSPVAYMAMLITALLAYIGIASVAPLAMKFAYVAAIFAIAAVLYLVIGKRW